MHRNSFASLAPSPSPRFQRPAREGSNGGSGSGFKRNDGGSDTGGSGFKRNDGGSGSGFKRNDGGSGSGFKRNDGGSGFKRNDGGSGSGFKRNDGGSDMGGRFGGSDTGGRFGGSDTGGRFGGSDFKRTEGGRKEEVFNATSASAFPALGPTNKKLKAPIWVAGQDTAKVIERALQVKTPPPPAAPRVVDFQPLEASYSSSEEEDYIPSFEDYQGGGWGDD